MVLRRGSIGQLGSVVGRVLLAVGVVLVAFVLYELWGTGLVESHDQARLRTALAHELPSGAARTTARAAASASRHRGASPATGEAVTASAPRLAVPEAAPAPGQPVGSIDIPSIGLDQVVVEGVAATDLALGPGHYPGTPLPGEAGNVAIAGHRTTYAHPFYDLTALKAGDPIVITTPQGVFTYTAGAQTVVQPTDVAVVGPGSRATLTLTTCNPRYSAATRLVLTASLTASVLFPATSDSTQVPTAGSASGRSKAAESGGDTTSSSALGTHGRTTPPPRAPPGSPSPLGAVLLGLSDASAWAGTELLARRARRRWPVYLAGGLVIAVVLFFFFDALSPLLPASL